MTWLTATTADATKRYENDKNIVSPSTLLLLRPKMRFPGECLRKQTLCMVEAITVHCQYILETMDQTKYLPALQVRRKWQRKERNIAINDLALVCDETSPRGHWPLGMVQGKAEMAL